MLGGMMLPFIQGILFYDEKITVPKVLCFLFICVALVLTVEKGEKRNGMIYYVGIFVLNGMSGVITKIYNTAPFARGNAVTYSVMSAVWGILVSSILLATLFRRFNEEKHLTLKSIGVAAANGTLNRIANFMLVISLVHVENTVQYPMVTGGVMIVSTIICFLGKQKPSKKQVLSIALAFFGTLALFIIPI
jgi:drug/metabolite transporter (DMT)-like permease